MDTSELFVWRSSWDLEPRTYLLLFDRRVPLRFFAMWRRDFPPAYRREVGLALCNAVFQGGLLNPGRLQGYRITSASWGGLQDLKENKTDGSCIREEQRNNRIVVLWNSTGTKDPAHLANCNSVEIIGRADQPEGECDTIVSPGWFTRVGWIRVYLSLRQSVLVTEATIPSEQPANPPVHNTANGTQAIRNKLLFDTLRILSLW